MADLELIPKLPVLAVQAGIFVANLAIMKKLFMDPYLKVREVQDGMTIGSQGDAARLLAEAEEISADINVRTIAAMTEAKRAREEVRAEAALKRQKILESAQKANKEELERLEADVKEQLDRERDLIPNVIAALANEVYEKAIR